MSMSYVNVHDVHVYVYVYRLSSVYVCVYVSMSVYVYVIYVYVYELASYCKRQIMGQVKLLLSSGFPGLLPYGLQITREKQHQGYNFQYDNTSFNI
ncbi:hypothetical protein STEG23_033200, partial [Scotinomys teguina]